MSHTVTVTRTTTTTTSAIILNTGYLKTLPGLLKVLEVILSGVALGIFAWYSDAYTYAIVAEQFFFCVITAVLVGSFCLLLSCLISLSTASIISKTIFEFIYHLFAFMLMTAASVTLMVELNDRYNRSRHYQAFFTAAVIGLVLSVLYFLSTILGYRSYKGRI